MNGGKIFDSIFDSLRPILDRINEHDPYTCLHSIQVAKLVEIFCEKRNFPKDVTEKLIAASFVHDYGKIKVKPEILNKVGVPTPEEFEEIKSHPGYTESLLKERINEINSKYLTDEIIEMAAQHHEAENGFGYPNSLKANKIKYGAKILHIADVFDALASERPYKEAETPECIYRTFAGDRQDRTTKEWEVNEQKTFDVLLLQSFICEISLQLHLELCAESLDYMHKINPEYDPAKEFAKLKGKVTKTIDEVIAENSIKSNTGIENSTLQKFLADKNYKELLENFNLREICTMLKVLEEMRRSDSVFVEVAPNSKGVKILTINEYEFAFKENDKATNEERNFFSEAIKKPCRGDIAGTLIGDKAIKEAEIKENQNKGL